MIEAKLDVKRLLATINKISIGMLKTGMLKKLKMWFNCHFGEMIQKWQLQEKNGWKKLEGEGNTTQKARFFCVILLMEEILHQFKGSFSHCLQGFIHPRWLAGFFHQQLLAFRLSGKASCQLLLPAACWWPWCHALTSRRTWSFLMPPRHIFFSTGLQVVVVW